MQLHEINTLLTLDTDFILYSETWRSSVGLDVSLKLDFVSKLPTSKGLFLILDQNKWVLHFQDLDSVPLTGEFGKCVTENIWCQRRDSQE